LNAPWGGGDYVDQAGREQTLVVRWDGSTWTQVPGPHVNDFQALYGVSFSRADDGWAVGEQFPSGGRSRTLVAHWNGSSWAAMPSPNPSPGNDVLSSVSADSTSDAWAVGIYQASPSVTDSLILRWDGSACTQVPSPNPDPQYNILTGVSVNAGDVWAVGYTVPGGVITEPLVVHHSP